MNTNEIATKQDIDILHKKINSLIDAFDKLISVHNNNSQEDYLTSKEVCQKYKISKSHLTDLRIEGKIPYSKPFGVFLYPQNEIEKIIKEGVHDKRIRYFV